MPSTQEQPVSSTLYRRILQACSDAHKAGYTPNGVRMNKTTYEQLGEEVGGPLMRGKTSSGVKVSALETPHGTLRLLFDKFVPDGTFVVTVAIPPLSRFPSRLYYDESGELSAEQE